MSLANRLTIPKNHLKQQSFTLKQQKHQKQFQIRTFFTFSTNTMKKTIKKNCFNFYLFKKLLFTMENATTAGYFLDKLEILTFATQKYLYNQ